MSFETNKIYAPRIHYEGLVYNRLRVLWKHKALVATVLGIALAALAAALILIAPRYTGEAMIQLDFTRNENAAGERVESTAAVDAAAVVDSAARIIRSRATASAVVSVLGLDKDPAYTSRSPLERVLTPVWSAYGVSAPTARDLAVTHLMKQISVTNDPRSYLITVAVTASAPERAARLANWVASEYLRGRLREQAARAHATAEGEVAGLSSVFGPRHPSYLAGRAKLGRLKAELVATQAAVVPSDREAVVAHEMISVAGGQTLLPAEAVMIPSGPNAVLLFSLTVLAALAIGILLSSLAESGLLRSRPVMSAPNEPCPGRDTRPAKDAVVDAEKHWQSPAKPVRS